MNASVYKAGDKIRIRRDIEHRDTGILKEAFDSLYNSSYLTVENSYYESYLNEHITVEEDNSWLLSHRWVERINDTDNNNTEVANIGFKNKDSGPDSVTLYNKPDNNNYYCKAEIWFGIVLSTCDMEEIEEDMKEDNCGDDSKLISSIHDIKSMIHKIDNNTYIIGVCVMSTKYISEISLGNLVEHNYDNNKCDKVYKAVELLRYNNFKAGNKKPNYYLMMSTE